MERAQHFTPRHINATKEDLSGNHGIGRYILLPGSDGRAKEIAKHFENLSVKSHPRGHHLYLGTIHHEGEDIDIATISSGMGCPSMEIILHELFCLGAKRFLRIGTAGSLQPNHVNMGDIINVQASVRDEHTTLDYAPLALPAVASSKLVSAITQAKNKINLPQTLHTGIVHCKSSFYAREYFAGPKSNANKKYIHLLKQCGVLATEMETATLFIQSQLYHQQLQQQGFGDQYEILSGAILGILAIPPDYDATSDLEANTIEAIIYLGLETVKLLAVTTDIFHHA